MSNRLPITVRIDQFEGPLDLLLYLIQSQELDISKIAISKITDQYLAYVRLMQELNFDLASDFLVMAATLIHWKSKALLPQDPALAAAMGADGDLELSPEELIRQLMEHQRFRQAAKDLNELSRLGEHVFTRPTEKIKNTQVFKEMDLSSMVLSLQDILVRARKRTQILKKETVSLTDKIMDFKERLAIGKLTELMALMNANPSHAEVVVTFLASLELSRLKKMRMYQEGVYQSIYVELLETLEAFDTKLASGFDNVFADSGPVANPTATPGAEATAEAPGSEPLTGLGHPAQTHVSTSEVSDVSL